MAPIHRRQPTIGGLIMTEPIMLDLILAEDASFEEIAVFAYRLATLLTVIPTAEFTKLLGIVTDALAHLGASWDDVFTYLKGNAA